MVACRLALKASIAAPPVSPEVAPTMVARVPRLRERPIHQPRQELHRHVLEGESRPMEQFEQPVIGVELLERRHRRMVEARIGFGDHALEVGFGNGAADEGRHHREGDLGIGLAAQRLELRSA